MSKIKILVVEDESIVAWDIQNILESLGYIVPARVASGLEAIQKVAETNPDLVLMDIKLQGDIDGVEAAEQIRLRYNIPIVYLTAHADEHTLNRAEITEPFGYIIKPFQQKELSATIKMALYKYNKEKDLHIEKKWLSRILKSIGDAVIVTDNKGLVRFMNPLAETLTGWKKEDAYGKDANEILDIIHAEKGKVYENPIRKVIKNGIVVRLAEDWILRTKIGTERFIGDSAAPIRDDKGNITGVVVVFQDITERKAAEEALRQQTDRERLMGAIAQRIRQSLNLEEILNTTVAEVREFLQTDRVLIFRFYPDWSGVVAVESVASDWPAILETTITDPCFGESYVNLYKKGRIQATEDIYTAGLSPCHINLLAEFKVRANLVVPILQGEQLWGLLAAHECNAPRKWQQLEIDLLNQLATQLAIALQQSELFEQVQHLNTDLELQVQERTQALQQALKFEAMLKRITDKVRDSLDESQILQTVVQELALVLGIDGCNTALYNPNHTTSTISYEYITRIPPAQGQVVQVADFPEGYRQLLQGQYFQFCELVPSVRGLVAVLACPIFDDQGVLGDLWLFKPRNEVFNSLEIRLVQQVANQCAIAIRQARLYQAAQAQVAELGKLNRLKDDFLSTISHELRTPVSNMNMAIQMLEITREQSSTVLSSTASSKAQNSHADRYFQILKDECDREMSLINDLLDLQRLDAETQPIEQTEIHLQDWIPHVIEPFEQRAENQQILLRVDISPDLPGFTSDLSRLGRILAELLNNACKYTPPSKEITVTARHQAGIIQLKVCNSGVEIPASELTHVFDKFYRVPSTDPWKQGGTGLGLALVKKLTEHLGGRILAESAPEQTCFTVELPINI
jgi:PAS domain S-box-containing protein